MVNRKDYQTFRDFVRQNGMQLSLQAIGVLVLILNLWLTSKLAPLAEGIRELGGRVLALETKRSTDDGETKILLERFYKLEEKVSNIDKTTTRIESKLDAHRDSE